MYTQTRAYTHGRPRANGRPRTNRAYEGDAGEYRAESRALNRFPGTYGREAARSPCYVTPAILATVISRCILCRPDRCAWSDVTAQVWLGSLQLHDHAGNVIRSGDTVGIREEQVRRIGRGRFWVSMNGHDARTETRAGETLAAEERCGRKPDRNKSAVK